MDTLVICDCSSVAHDGCEVIRQSLKWLEGLARLGTPFPDKHFQKVVVESPVVLRLFKPEEVHVLRLALKELFRIVASPDSVQIKLRVTRVLTPDELVAWSEGVCAVSSPRPLLALSHKYTPMHMDSKGNALPGKRVLILGCGHDGSVRHGHAGCDTLDMKPGKGQTFVRDVFDLGPCNPLPVPDKYYDTVFAEHVPLFISNVGPEQFHGAVRELFRIAKSPDAVRVAIMERLAYWSIEDLVRFVL